MPEMERDKDTTIGGNKRIRARVATMMPSAADKRRAVILIRRQHRRDRGPSLTPIATPDNYIDA